MYRYLEHYTDEEKWAVLKDGEVKTVHEVIDAVEDLYYEPNLLNIETLKKVEETNYWNIEELNEDDKEVLQDMIHKVLRYAYELLNENFNNRRFLKDRLTDRELQDAFEPVFEWFEQGDRIVNHWITHGRGSEDDRWGANMLAERTQEWRDEKELVVNEAMADASESSTSWIRFIELNIEREQQKLERHIRHFEDNVFGQWLQDVRDERGYSYRIAAQKLGVSVRTLQNIESGKHERYGIALLNKLAYVYEIPVAKLMSMYVGPIQTLEEIVEEQSFSIVGHQVSTGQKLLLKELVQALTADDMVEAHLKLDELGAVVTRLIESE